MRNGSRARCCLWEHPGRGSTKHNSFPRWYPTGPRFLVLPLLGPQEGGGGLLGQEGVSREEQLGACFFFHACLVRLHIGILCIWNVWGPLSGLCTQVPRSQGQPWERAASCICLPRCSPENVLMEFSFNSNHNSRGLLFHFFDCAAEDWMTSLRNGP